MPSTHRRQVADFDNFAPLQVTTVTSGNLFLDRTAQVTLEKQLASIRPANTDGGLQLPREILKPQQTRHEMLNFRTVLFSKTHTNEILYLITALCARMLLKQVQRQWRVMADAGQCSLLMLPRQ